MPPAAKRNCGVVLFDVNASNKSEALAALVKIYTYNWLSSTKDTYRLILTNTKESRDGKGYNNLYDTNINALDPQIILNRIVNAKPEKGNWLEAILLGIHFLKEEFSKPGIITLQILYLTNLDGNFQDLDDDKVKQIIKDLKEYNIFLYIIGPKVKLPYTITKLDDVSDCMKEIQVDESNSSLSVAKKIITNTDNSIMCELKVGIHLFFSYKNPYGSQPWKVPLSFGTHLEIPVCTVKTYKRDTPFKLSLEKPSYTYVLEEDESLTVEKEVLVTGIARHGKFVRVFENDMFKLEGPRSFSIIEFTSENNIPEYYMRGEGTFYVLPDHEKADSCQAIYNLVDILTEEKKYAIARRVYNANNKPKFFVLIPQPNLEPKCFVMSELPYADDVQQEYKFGPAKISEEHNRDENDVFNKFFKSIDIWNPDCKINIPLSPKLMLDSYTTKLANESAKKYLNQDFEFDTLDVNDTEESEINEFLDALRETWPEYRMKISDETG